MRGECRRGTGSKLGQRGWRGCRLSGSVRNRGESLACGLASAGPGFYGWQVLGTPPMQIVSPVVWFCGLPPGNFQHRNNSHRRRPTDDSNQNPIADHPELPGPILFSQNAGTDARKCQRHSSEKVSWDQKKTPAGGPGFELGQRGLQGIGGCPGEKGRNRGQKTLARGRVEQRSWPRLLTLADLGDLANRV
jgi:hypothetical protein